MIGVEPMRSGRVEPGLACTAFVSMGNCSVPSGCARLKVRENNPRTLFQHPLRLEAIMARKSRNPNFDQMLEILRAHSFDVAPFAGVSGGVLVSKHGAGAVLVATKDDAAPAAFAESPGALVGGEVARLLDRGYQKFIKTPQFELPASASQLQRIHLFSEELKQLTGAISLYNESLGTTSDVYEYDRLRGREPAQPASARPLGADRRTLIHP
jgi:hypothetical protein